MTQNSSALTRVIGTYECKLDAKGRFAMPVPLRKQLIHALEEGFVLKRSVFESCLELYPMAAWRAVMQKLNRLNRFVKKNSDFVRLFTAGVKCIEIDGHTRILVPRDLIGFAGLRKEIVLSSSIDILEIWDKQRYEDAIGNTAIDFSELAEDVMGSMPGDGLS